MMRLTKPFEIFSTVRLLVSSKKTISICTYYSCALGNTIPTEGEVGLSRGDRHLVYILQAQF